MLCVWDKVVCRSLPVDHEGTCFGCKLRLHNIGGPSPTITLYMHFLVNAFHSACLLLSPVGGRRTTRTMAEGKVMAVEELLPVR